MTAAAGASLALELRNITCRLQVSLIGFLLVPRRAKRKRRSECPVSISLETVGDRWSLLIVRDLMVRGLRTFKEFQQSVERIATNILTDRLRKLKSEDIITAETDPADRRRVSYRLTEKGIDLAPVLLELLVWGARHENPRAFCGLIETMARNREHVLAEVRRRWNEGDPNPLQVDGEWRLP